MKASLWICSVVTTLVYVSQQVAAEPYIDTSILEQDNNFVTPAKRTKASLSIVNPLDVLRQRIILEMARRRMQENSMQVNLQRQRRQLRHSRHSPFVAGESCGT